MSELLERYHKTKVIVLIDEYDVPLDKAQQHGYYNEMITLMRAFLGSALKTNSSLEFAVLTGCMRISKESIFTGSWGRCRRASEHHTSEAAPEFPR